jgi:hypothetical protein
MIASLPVLQADELDVTWFPRASRPAIRALVPLFITCSTIRLPRRRTLPSLTMGTTVRAMVSMPPIPQPTIAPVSQSTRSSPVSGKSNPASRHASTAVTEA